MPCKCLKDGHSLSKDDLVCTVLSLTPLLHVNNTHVSLYFQFLSWPRRIFWCQWGSHCLSGRRLAYGSTVYGLITKISSKITSIEGEEGA